MRTVLREERIGELLGPVDWSYDFASHAWGPSRGGGNPEWLARTVEWLRKLAAAPSRYEVSTDTGCPRTGYKRVLAVGMYDGWPHWKPVPSVCIAGTLGPEWVSFYMLTELRELPPSVAGGDR